MASKKLATSLLVTPEWLLPRLSGGGKLRMLDCSMYLPHMKRDAQAEYDARRIPGSAFFDIDACSAPGPFEHTLPGAAPFQEYVRALGVDDGDEVVLYDGLGIFSAPRVWWMLREYGVASRVLDGGLPAYVAAGGTLEEGAPPAIAGGTFTAVAREPAGWCDLAALRANVELPDDGDGADGAAAAARLPVLDARAGGRYLGTAPEPRAGLPSGPIPRSISVPFSSLLGDGGTYKAPEELRRTFAEAGFAPSGGGSEPLRFFASCGSGVTACAVILGAELAFGGGVEATLFDGAWTEWGTTVVLPLLEELQGALPRAAAEAAASDPQAATALREAAALLAELQMVEGAGRALVALGTASEAGGGSTPAADECRKLALQLLPDFDEATWRATFDKSE